MLGSDQPFVADDRWSTAAQGLPLTPFECKAIYVAGLIRHLAESAGLCLEEGRHLAAFLLTVGGVEALGAVVVQGNERGPTQVLADGLAFLAGGSADDRDTIVVETMRYSYSIRDCLNRRGFTAHGARVLKGEPAIVLEAELTVGLLCRLVDALDRWWQALDSDRAEREALASAAIRPLVTSGRIVFVHDLLEPLANGGLPGGVLEHQAWRSSC